jgi:hypothetical protein
VLVTGDEADEGLGSWRRVAPAPHQSSESERGEAPVVGERNEYKCRERQKRTLGERKGNAADGRPSLGFFGPGRAHTGFFWAVSFHTFNVLLAHVARKEKISLHFLSSANIVQKSSYTAKVNPNISY